jgi:hypothetical protein
VNVPCTKTNFGAPPSNLGFVGENLPTEDRCKKSAKKIVAKAKSAAFILALLFVE